MSNPIEEYQQEKTSAKEQRKKDELALWNRWKTQGQQPQHLEPLMKLYDPVLGQKMRAWRAPNVPESAFKKELETHLIKAFESYDPTRGAALNTHVEARLPKAKRYNNRYQNLAYIPEGQSGYIGKIQKAHDQLSEELGRPPTNDEIGDHIGLPGKRVGVIRASTKRDIPMGRSAGAENFDYSVGSEPTARGFEDQQIAVAQHILPEIFPNKPLIHEVFHYTFGTGGRPQILATGALAKKMKLTEPQVSRLKTQMGKELRKQFGLADKEEP